MSRPVTADCPSPYTRLPKIEASTYLSITYNPPPISHPIPSHALAPLFPCWCRASPVACRCSRVCSFPFLFPPVRSCLLPPLHPRLDPFSATCYLLLANLAPWIQLHAHLSGSISRHCLHRIWAHRSAADHDFTLQDPLHAIPQDKVDYDLDT
jgi:hypothetical protein